MCRPNEKNGWVHKYELECDGLKILDFQEKNVLAWLAELMKHRDAADSKRYRMLASKFIDKYGIDTETYDVIKGWRANASYFYIAKEFVRDNIDVDILEELLSLGGLGIQYCIKTERAYAGLHELKDELETVEYTEFNDRYNARDIMARKKMRDLVNSCSRTIRPNVSARKVSRKTAPNTLPTSIRFSIRRRRPPHSRTAAASATASSAAQWARLQRMNKGETSSFINHQEYQQSTGPGGTSGRARSFPLTDSAFRRRTQTVRAMDGVKTASRPV